MDSATAPHDLIARVRERVRDLESLEPGERDVSAVDLIDEMESLKNAAAAAQARASHLLEQSRVAERAHLPAPKRDRGVATEVALARRESPHRGSVHLGLAGVLVRELPHTLAAMEAGRCSEWRAIQIAQGTACLSLEDRQQIDTELMADPATTEGWGERRFRAEVDRRAYTADPSAALASGATIVTNKRELAADDYFTGLFETALDEGEFIKAVKFPIPEKAAYIKFEQPASRFALVGVFVAKGANGVRVAVTGASEGGVFRWTEAEQALSSNFSASALDGLTVSADNMIGDIHGSKAYRAHLVGVVTKRAVNAC